MGGCWPPRLGRPAFSLVALLHSAAILQKVPAVGPEHIEDDPPIVSLLSPAPEAQRTAYSICRVWA